MRDDFRGLRLCQAIVHRPIEVVGNLRNLAGSKQGADSDETPISRHKVRTHPQVSPKAVDASRKVLSGPLHRDFGYFLFDLPKAN